MVGWRGPGRGPLGLHRPLIAHDVSNPGRFAQAERPDPKLVQFGRNDRRIGIVGGRGPGAGRRRAGDRGAGDRGRATRVAGIGTGRRTRPDGTSLYILPGTRTAPLAVNRSGFRGSGTRAEREPTATPTHRRPIDAVRVRRRLHGEVVANFSVRPVRTPHRSVRASHRSRGRPRRARRASPWRPHESRAPVGRCRRGH